MLVRQWAPPSPGTSSRHPKPPGEPLSFCRKEGTCASTAAHATGMTKYVTLAAISPRGVTQGRFVGGHQSGLAGCKSPPLFKRGASSCLSQQQRQREPWGASPRPSAPTYPTSHPTPNPPPPVRGPPPYKRGGVGRHPLAMSNCPRPRPTAQRHWAEDLLQCTATLPGGVGRPSNFSNALPHCSWAVGSRTSTVHCLTAWQQWAMELLQYGASPLQGSGQ